MLFGFLVKKQNTSNNFLAKLLWTYKILQKVKKNNNK